MRFALRLLGALSEFPHGKGRLKEELRCGIGFTKSGSTCLSWKGLARQEPEALRKRGLSAKLHENEAAGRAGGTPGSTCAAQSSFLKRSVPPGNGDGGRGRGVALMGVGRVDRACLGTQGGAKQPPCGLGLPGGCPFLPGCWKATWRDQESELETEGGKGEVGNRADRRPRFQAQH